MTVTCNSSKEKDEFLSLSLGELSGSRVRADYFGNRSVLGEARRCLRQNKSTFVTHAHEISAMVPYVSKWCIINI